MSLVPKIVIRRRKRRESRARSALLQSRKVGVTFLALLGILLAFFATWLGIAYSNITRELPSIQQLSLLFEFPNGHLLLPTTMYDRSGEYLIYTFENPIIQLRNYIPIDGNFNQGSLPDNLINAVIAIFDPNYWEHGGATITSLNLNSAPTLTQIIVTELLLFNEPDNQHRRLRAGLLALQATSTYGRSTLLEWYLNSADFGNLTYGADAAAQVYFGKFATNLTLSEAALLAAVAQAPDLNPINAPELAIERQGKVLEAMLAQGFISLEQATNANNLPLELRTLEEPPENPYQDFIDLVSSQLRPHFGLGRLKRGGLKIITTLDIDLQSQSACAANKLITRINQPNTIITECQASRLLPALRQNETLIPAGISANVIIIEPSTGQILTLIGAARDQHTPGTILSPFVYLTAFTRGFSPSSLVWDIPTSLPSELSGYTNVDGEFHGPLSMRLALANDYLVSTLQTLIQVGQENVWITAQQSGINGIGPAPGEVSPRILLDDGALQLLEVTHSYSMLANQGFLSGQPSATNKINGTNAIQPTSVLKVVDYSNRSFLDWVQPQIRAVSSAQLAYLITDILSDDEARRASLGRPNFLEIGRPAASKIGRTTSQLDSWTVGYTPQLAVGVWLGYSDTSESSVVPASLSSGLWNAVVRYAHLDLPTVAWDVPAGMIKIDVCTPSGLLPTVVCPSIAEEIFIPGNEPVQLDNLYRIVQINRLTGRLATVFTLPENIDEQIFLSLPPEALEWARQTNFPVPPEIYDVLFITDNQNSDVSLSSPAMFSYVNGRIEIIGSAMGAEFDFYRVQVGEGLNPSQWLQIGTDGISPVNNAPLAVWNSGDANGLFAIQLIVVYQDKSVETSTIQVTVDNQAPEVVILYPQNLQTFNFPEQRNITFQVQASDNLGIDRVEYFLDGKQISILTQAPFAVPWLVPLGEHTLQVIVYDLAGNSSETEIDFELQR